MTSGTAQILAGEDRDELRMIMRWLRNEHELRGQISQVNGPAQPDQMGGMLDAVAIAISGGGAGTVLIKSLFTYLGQRRKDVVLNVRLKREDGRELELKLSNPESSDAIVEQAFRFFGNAG